MNSTFKVVFNKARGALMVVNEVTSSVQAKGTKTVVATAVAAMIAGVAGTATAAESTWTKTEWTNVSAMQIGSDSSVTVTGTTPDFAGDNVKVLNGQATVDEEVVTSGALTVKPTDATKKDTFVFATGGSSFKFVNGVLNVQASKYVAADDDAEVAEAQSVGGAVTATGLTG
ncbi:MAG: ESPR-type extended signal peptide-containing protein, partial [Sutterella sp.]